MAHNHAGHSHGAIAYGRAFAIGVVLNLGFVVVEFVFGRLSGSLALVADAGHNLGDVLGLVLAWGAALLATRRASLRRTYGFRSSTILAALINAIVLLFAVGAIVWEAIERLEQPQPVGEVTVMVVAAVGIVINGVTALLFASGRKEDLNIRGAFLHMAADAGVSLGVVISAALMLATGWLWLDPVVSLVVAAAILLSTWGLLRDSVNLALAGVPSSIDLNAVQSYFAGVGEIQEVHDLHVWALSTTEPALTAHLVVGDRSDGDGLIRRVERDLHDRFGIEHTTLQLETEAGCRGCDGDDIPLAAVHSAKQT